MQSELDIAGVLSVERAEDLGAVSAEDNDHAIPLGVSLYALLPFTHYWQELAKDRCDDRVKIPRIELLRQLRPELISKYWGLPSSVDELAALGIDKVKEIAESQYIFVKEADEGDIGAWIAALRAPIKSTGDFCQYIVKMDTAPLSAAEKAAVSCSFVEHLQRQPVSRDDTGRTLWGTASHFISHAWSYDWEDLVLALMDLYHGMPQHERIKCYFWIDIFCVDQHKAAAGWYGSAFWEEKFQMMVRNINHTVCIIMPWSKPVCMARIWCLWEIYSTVINDVKLTIAMTEKERISLQHGAFEDIDGAMGKFLSIDAQHAQATDPADKKHIGGKIEQSAGGYDKLNAVVRGALLAQFVTFIAFVGDAPRLAKMIHENPFLGLEAAVDIQSAKNRQYTPLQHACRCGHTSVVRLLLQHGASVTASEIGCGMNALHLAALAGHYEVAQLLVEIGMADPFDNGVCAFGISPAHIAAEFGRSEMLVYFISSYISKEKALSSRGRGGETLLYCCDDSYEGSSNGAFEHYKGPPKGLYAELARRNYTSEQPNWDEADIICNREQIAAYLRLNGVPAECEGQLLGSACRSGDVGRVREMLSNSKELQEQINTPFKCSKQHGSLIFTAIMQLANLKTALTDDHVAVLDVLLDFKADPMLTFFREHYDADGNLRILTQLATDECVGDNLLHRMARYTPSLIDNYADSTPSMRLGDGVQIAMARLLLSKGGLQVDARNRPNGEGVTALHYAAMGRKPELVRFLVEEGRANVNAQVIGGINDGWTALRLAEHGNFAMGPTTAARKKAVVDYLRSVGAVGGREIVDDEEEAVNAVQSISIANLVDMGFDLADVEAALAASNGNAMEAMNRLLEGDV